MKLRIISPFLRERIIAERKESPAVPESIGWDLFSKFTRCLVATGRRASTCRSPHSLLLRFVVRVFTDSTACVRLRQVR
jgi:hypothetical protein